MSQPFLGEIRMMAFNFAPQGWAYCNGQLLAINQNTALFSLLGTTYGGDGQVTFALPNLQGRVPMHRSSSHPLGQRAGAASHALTVAELPGHTHSLRAVAGAAGQRSLSGNMLGGSALDLYGSSSPSGTMDAAALGSTGGGAAHSNVQPYLGVPFCIALAGIFPS